MDLNLPKEQQEKRADPYYPSADEFQLYTNERHTKKDFKQKKVRYKKGPRADDSFPPDLTFQVPEKDKNKYLAFPAESFVKSSKYSDKQNIDPEQFKEPSRTKNRSPTLRYDEDVNYLPSAPMNRDPSMRNERFDNQRNNMAAHSYNKEQVTNQINYNPSTAYSNYQKTNKRVASEIPNPSIDKQSSLICRAINQEGEPVTVNDKVIKDKLILSCRPRTHYGPGGYLKQPLDADSIRNPNYIYPPPQISVIDNVSIQQTTDVDVHQYQRNRLEELEYYNKQKPPLVRGNAYDIGSLGLGDQGLQPDKQGEKYEEQYRVMQCKRYMRTFRSFLWALFIINLLLLLTGIALLLLTLVHSLFKSYINTVIGHAGFAVWIWAAMGLSLLIILVAVYGIATSITRARKMLFVYCILALVLAVIIVVFLMICWIVHTNLKSTEKESMNKTFHMYRCFRWMRVAWDTLHEQFECCGIEDRVDWKYIPTSCCQAESKYQKLRCIGHFIAEDQAFKGGCRSKLEDYFTTQFLLITCLLVLAVILLLLGVLAALRLLKMYKIIMLCRDMYMITS